ncbi:glycoside hydrolase family 18 protein [Maribacter polysiphoniae]|uniref:glycoside hydrolase family 18 protein n=1 Tax=Maribacter polysiphoniae TaxID=429344 RepID=UPI002353D09B|nr:glycoside hydrolase family 18 protein [Maribacter polysiphoniae]
MKRLGYYVLLFMGIILTASFVHSENAEPRNKKGTNVVMAYYVPEKDYRPDELPLHQLTHIIYSFTNVIDGKMQFRDAENEAKLKALVAERKKHPNLKVMVACGGWGADGFSDMAHTPENRKRFVQSVLEFNTKYELDGLDIDWEYPAIPAANTGARPEDKENFTLLMKALREGLDTLKRDQTLTFASAGWKRYYNNVEITEVMKYVDYMNVMTYDQIGATSPYTGHHTALGLVELDDVKDTPAAAFIASRREEMKKRGYTYEPRSVERIVDFCIAQGVAPEQIVIGCAFYGRAWKGVPPENNGLYQSNKGSYIGWSAYNQIRKEFESNKNYKRYWDPVAKAPYLYSEKDSVFISYDDTVSVALKTAYAKQKKLAGIMFWELGNDTKEANSLLNAIYGASKKK